MKCPRALGRDGLMEMLADKIEDTNNPTFIRSALCSADTCRNLPCICSIGKLIGKGQSAMILFCKNVGTQQQNVTGWKHFGLVDFHLFILVMSRHLAAIAVTHPIILNETFGDLKENLEITDSIMYKSFGGNAVRGSY